MWLRVCVFNISAGDTGQCNKTRKKQESGTSTAKAERQPNDLGLFIPDE